MGEVVKFRRARLSGFLPDDLGLERKVPFDTPPNRDVWSAESLYAFAKTGGPTRDEDETD